MPNKRRTLLALLLLLLVGGLTYGVFLTPDDEAPLRREVDRCLSSLHEGSKEEGLAHCRQAVSLAPDDPDALLNLGVVLLAAEKPEEAIEPLAHLAAVAPTTRGHITLGMAQERARRYEEALDTFKRAEAMAPPESRRRKAATAAVERVAEKMR